MCLGRDVQSSLILLSCIAVPCSGIGTFRTEAAKGLSICTASGDSATPGLLSYPCDCAHRLVFSSGEGEDWSARAGNPDSAPLAMAIPDGPGAVCLGVLGFVCVSVLKNRRVWIGLCLYVLGSGRMSMSRLSRAGVAGPANPDPPGRGESGHFLRCNPLGQAFRPPASVSLPEALVLGSQCTHSFLSDLRDVPYSKGLAPQADVALRGWRKTRPEDLRERVPLRSLSVKCVELARPPPPGTQTTLDGMDLSSDSPLLAQLNRRKR
jgi:hypothetical protein